MTRRKSPVVLPQPATPVLRRSARLISLQNRDCQMRSEKDLAFRSEPPPRKSHRKLVPEVSGRLAFEDSSSKKSPGSNSSIDGFSSPRRSLRISKLGFSGAGKEDPSQCNSAKPAFTPSSRVKSTSVSSSFTLRRSPRFSSGGGSLRRSPRFSSGGGSVDVGSGNCVLSRCSTNSISSEKGNGRDGVRSRDRSRCRSRSRSRPRPKTKQMFRDSDDDKEEEEEVNCVLSKFSTKSVSSKKGKDGDGVRSRDRSRSRSRPRPKAKQMFRDIDDEEEEEVNCVLSKSCTKSVSSEKGKEGDGVRSRDRSRSRPPPKTKQMFKDLDEEEEKEEVSVCLTEKKRMRIAEENEEEDVVSKADEGKRIEMEVVEEEGGGLKTKNKLEKGWTEELEVALQGAYLTVKPSPHFWKNVSKMVPGKSAQECFDRVNSDLITPRQPQPRSRARKTNLSPIPHFSLSASKLLKPNSPKTKIRQRRNNLSKKTIRHLLEKQNQMDQGLGYDLFSVLEPGTTINFLSSPIEKGKTLPRILECQVPGSSEDQTKLVSPAVLKQVKNKALHEKYIDHLHVREAKRKAESSRLARKENIRPSDNQKKDSVRAAKDALFFDVQDAVQKLKSLEAENSSSSSEFCYETDEEDDTI